MDFEALKKKLTSKLKETNIRTADQVQYIDINNDSMWVDGPDWYRMITGIRGITTGFVYEFVGKPDSGKSSTGQHFMVQAQKKGWVVILVDAEKKFSFSRYEKMGGNCKTLFIISESTIEHNFDALEKMEKAISEEDKDAKILVVYDSIAVGGSMKELEKDITDVSQVAEQAKLLKRCVRRQLPLLQQCNVAFIAINQCYAKIGPMSRGGTQASGGQGLEYGKALSLKFSRIKVLSGSRTIG
jgi:RecA/RadA recombinase